MKPPTVAICLLIVLCVSTLSAESWVRWNQLGYRPDQPKEIIVMSDRDLAGENWLIRGAQVQHSGRFGESLMGIGPNTPKPFNHEIDLSEIRALGDYTLEVPGAESALIRVREQPFAEIAHLPLVHLRMSRSGTDTVKWRRPSHFGDAEAWVMVPDGDPTEGSWQREPNGRIVDGLGGWYDAGDHIKFTLTTTYALYHLTVAYGVAPEIFQRVNSTSELPDVLDEIRHGLHYALKLWPDRDTFIVQVGDTRDHNQGWRLPADDALDGDRPAKTALARVQMASTVAALARGSRVMRGHDDELADRCAAMARALMRRALEPDTVSFTFERSSTNDFYRDPTERDQMCLAALELAVLFPEEDWLKVAAEYAPGPGGEAGWADWHWLANTGLTAAGIEAGREGLSAEVGSYLSYARESGQPWGVPIRYVWGSLARWIGAAHATRAAQDADIVHRDGTVLFNDVLTYVFGRNNWGVSFFYDERLPNRLENLYSPTAELLQRYPVGALSAGPAQRRMHESMRRYFDPPPNPRLDPFQTESAVFFDYDHDFVCHEATIGAQADIVLMLAIASRGDEPINWGWEALR